MKANVLSIIAILFSITLYSQTPVPPGDISGIWTLEESPYLLSGDNTVPDGMTLTIEPGVVVEWRDSKTMFIQGQILAEGTESDSIIFTAADTADGFNSIRFIDTPSGNDTSRFAYCTFQYGRAHGAYPDNCGGAIAAMNFGKIIIDHCYFHHNKAMEYDILGNGSGAIGLTTSSPRITNSKFENNEALLGGAIVCYLFSDPLIQNNLFTSNSAPFDAYPSGYGGAILIASYSDPEIRNNIFHGNYAETGGGAIACVGNCNPTIAYNLIIDNTSDWIGGGIELQDTSSAIITNNTIANNSADEGGGIDLYSYCYPQIRNNILWGNTAVIGSQVNIMENNSVPDFYYCDIEGGDTAFGGAPFTGLYIENIDTDPAFRDPSSGDYCLLMGVSPCIDTGDPDPIYNDPDGSRNDMGALWPPCYPLGIGDSFKVQDSRLTVQCFPNPSEGITDIRYRMPDAEFVSLKVSDMKGKEIAVIVSKEQSQGEYHVRFDASDLPAGIYLIRLQSGSEVVTRKIVKL